MPKKGYKQLSEHTEAMRKSVTGLKKSESHKENLRNSLKGRKLTKLHRINISKALEGKGITNTHRLLFKKNVNVCRLCKTDNNLTVNHIVPKVAGGGDNIENLEILCLACNIKEYHRIVKIAINYYFESLKMGN